MDERNFFMPWQCHCPVSSENQVLFGDLCCQTWRRFLSVLPEPSPDFQFEGRCVLLCLTEHSTLTQTLCPAVAQPPVLLWNWGRSWLLGQWMVTLWSPLAVGTADGHPLVTPGCSPRGDRAELWGGAALHRCREGSALLGSTTGLLLLFLPQSNA